MALLDTTPSALTVGFHEQLAIGFDASAYQLAANDTGIANVNAVLTAVNGTAPVTLVDNPTVIGNVITQKVRGSALTPGASYYLIVYYTGTPSNTVWEMRLLIQCPRDS